MGNAIRSKDRPSGRAMVTWNRVLAGRWLDAQVGSHILIGAAVGSGLWVFFKAVMVYVFHNSQPGNWDVSLGSLLGARHWIGAHAGGANDALAAGCSCFWRSSECASYCVTSCSPRWAPPQCLRLRRAKWRVRTGGSSR